MSGVLLPSASNARLWIVGNPENRRVQDFQAAAIRGGMIPPACESWNRLLSNPRDSLERLQQADLIRIDSPGENDGVTHRLIQLGGGSGRLAFGEIGLLEEQHRGFCEAMAWLSDLDVPFQTSPHDIRTMFDKWDTHQLLVASGIVRPLTDLAPRNVADFDTFRDTFGSSKSGRLFLKPRYSSSASGVCALRWAGDRQQLIAPIEIDHSATGVRLFNSLRVRSYSKLDDINAVLEHLLPQGMVCEKWIQKARLDKGHFDVRIVVVSGEARHIVVRVSNSPMTNLHLGNRRGDLNAVREHLGNDCIRRCQRLAERAMECFPDSLYAGVDVLVTPKGEPMVCEVNAFGDLLPGLTHRGETTYEAIVARSAKDRPMV